MTTGRGETLQHRKGLCCSVMVVGIGGAGGNIATDLQSTGALDGLGLAVQWLQVDTGPWKYRLSMGDLSLARKGTGGHAELGRALARKHRYLLRPLMAQTDIVILVAGLGGGTGSGIAPYIARLARDAGVLTIAAVTMPFDFEGRRHKTADTAIKRLRCHALLVFRFSNQELARELGDNALMTAIYEVQTLRIALWLRDLLVSRHFDQFHPLAKPSKRGRARL